MPALAMNPSSKRFEKDSRQGGVSAGLFEQFVGNRTGWNSAKFMPGKLEVLVISGVVRFLG
jgi:hypothetical protein